MIVKVSMNVEIDKKDLPKLIRIEHHAEALLDLDNWNEIKSVYNVRVDPEEI